MTETLYDTACKKHLKGDKIEYNTMENMPGLRPRTR